MFWVKSMSWRAISTGSLVHVGKTVTDKWSSGGTIPFIHTVITIALYVPHDLLWERWKFQRTHSESKLTRPAEVPG